MSNQLTKAVDISPEGVDMLTDCLREYGNVVGKRPDSQDAQCHMAADMLGALRAALTERDALLRDIHRWFEDKRMGTYQYMEGSEFYEDKSVFVDRITDLIGDQP